MILTTDTMKKTLLFLLFSTILIGMAIKYCTLEDHDTTAVIEDRFEKNSKVIEKSHDGDVHEFLVVYKRDNVYSVISVTHWPSCKYCNRTSPETECLTPDLIKKQMSNYNQQLKQIQSQLIVPQLLPKYNE